MSDMVDAIDEAVRQVRSLRETCGKDGLPATERALRVAQGSLEEAANVASDELVTRKVLVGKGGGT